VLFSVSSDYLPEPLPSPEAIEASPFIIKELSVRCTKRVGSSYVVKYGAEVEPVEAENMRYVQQANIAVPTVYAVYQRAITPTANMTYIIMDEIPGDTLEVLWKSLSPAQKSSITMQLQNAFKVLRSIPSPGYFGSLGRLKLHDGIFWTPQYDSTISGPFETEDQLIHGMLERHMQDCGDRVRQKTDYYRRILPRYVRGNGVSVFTHNDLQRKNIILRPDGGVVILDWAASGWYPQYWEYATTLHACGLWEDDWHVYATKILDEFPNEYMWMRTLRLEMWG
jgi:serine/threonine protein kinase